VWVCRRVLFWPRAIEGDWHSRKGHLAFMLAHGSRDRDFTTMNMFSLFEWLAMGALLLIWFTVTRIERRLDKQEMRVDLLLRQAGIDPSRPAEPSDHVKLLAQQPSQRIEAIKAYRRETGADLRSAKAVIESLQSSSDR